MLIKHDKAMTDSERIAAENSNNQFLQALALAAQNAPDLLKAGDEFVFLGGDSDENFQIELVIDDKLSETSENPIQNQAVAKALSAISYAAHPIGSLYWGTDPTDPSELLGGTWELIDKEFAPTELYNVGLTINTDTVSSGSSSAKLAGHTVEITVKLINHIDIDDTNNVNWGSLTPSAFGCSEFSQTLEPLSVNDGSNGCVMFAVTNAGVIASGDTVGVRPLTAAGTNNIFTVIFTQMPHLMLDDYCNKFCWKRTA